MSINSENEIMAEDEINLYDYWKIIVKRRKILLGIFFIPVVITIIVALIIPRYYRGISEMTNTIIPASNIVNLIGNIDDAKKVKVFASNSGVIKNVFISLHKKSTNKISIIIDAKTADIIPQSFNNLFDYVNSLPEIKGAVANIQAEADLKTEKLIEETDYKIKKLVEIKEANLTFLHDVLYMTKKRKLPLFSINPADLIEKDNKLSIEIKNLELVKSNAVKKKELNIKISAATLSELSITKQPSNEKVKQSIIITVVISLMSAIFIVFFLDYIERMKMRNNK